MLRIRRLPRSVVCLENRGILCFFNRVVFIRRPLTQQKSHHAQEKSQLLVLGQVRHAWMIIERRTVSRAPKANFRFPWDN
jgi:hypothetical protein